MHVLLMKLCNMPTILQHTWTYRLLVRLERCIAVDGQAEDLKKGETVKKIHSDGLYIINTSIKDRFIHFFLQL